MPELKTGDRLKSTVCDGEVMVVSAPSGDIEITCGGAPMASAADAAKTGDVDPGHAVGIAMGKGYIAADETLEVLCVKAGAGGLAIGGHLLLQKDTKQLPKTD